MEIKTKNTGLFKAALLFGVAFLAFMPPARAEDVSADRGDPFTFQQGSWVPFGAPAESEKTETSAIEQGRVVSSPDQAPHVSLPSAATPKPLRAISLSPLPTIGPGLQADGEPLEEVKKIDYDNSPMTVSVEDDAWRAISMVKHTGYYNENPIEKSLRYAVLPGIATLEPVPAGSATKRNRVTAQAAVLATKEAEPTVTSSVVKDEPKKVPSPEERAACDEMSAYKKRQLAAIQSDSKTLSALRAVIAEFGAKDKVDVGALNSPRAPTKMSETKITDGAASSSDQTKRQ